ncbi:HAD family hydrolase [Streptomyces inhibens]|uniref:HAD family hydrolase n=1 Tax=Streptomyces inhibens TaxID=2293571 RepID=UPI001FD3A303|nr:HAD family hydrolase [Streptomyces inhibens]
MPATALAARSPKDWTAQALGGQIGNGARRGTLIKGGTHLEGIGRVTVVVFDKTGTLTFGRPLVTSVVSLSAGCTADEVLSLAASGELHARHPLAQAIVARTEERHLQVPVHQTCEVVLGVGMRAELDDTRLLVDSPALLVSVQPGDLAWGLERGPGP